MNSHGFLADDPDEAAELAFPPFSGTMDRIGRERGWPPTTRARLEAERAPDGPRPLPHERVLRAIELLGTEVAPAVRRELGEPAEPPVGEASSEHSLN